MGSPELTESTPHAHACARLKGFKMRLRYLLHIQPAHALHGSIYASRQQDNLQFADASGRTSDPLLQPCSSCMEPSPALIGQQPTHLHCGSAQRQAQQQHCCLHLVCMENRAGVGMCGGEVLLEGATGSCELWTVVITFGCGLLSRLTCHTRPQQHVTLSFVCSQCVPRFSTRLKLLFNIINIIEQR